MLVLSRKPNEEIVIAGNIRVKILEIKGNRVRLGISAPEDVAVHRQEVLDTPAGVPVVESKPEAATV